MIYFYIAIFLTGLFIVQTVLSIIFGGLDTDLDIDGDGSVDLDISGIISFKGLLHFGIGFSWGMWLMDGSLGKTLSIIISIGLGLLMAVMLYFTYWGVIKLKKEVIPEKREDLVGRTSEIYFKDSAENEWIVFMKINGSLREIPVTSKSNKNYASGEKVTIIEYKDGKYWIP